MALSGTVNGTVTNKSAYFTFYFTWSATQNVTGNYSDVTVKTYIKTNNTAWDFDTVAARSHSITINGTTTSIDRRINCNNNWANGNPYLIQTATTRVYHNSDGSKSITISARSNGTASSYGYSSGTASSNDATASTTVTLNAIPRRSTLSVSYGTLGVEQTVTATRYMSSFTHTLTWASGSYSGTIATKSAQTSWSFTPSLDLANGAPNGQSVYVSFTLSTYNGDTVIGTYYTTAWMTIPNTNDFKPSIASIVATESVTDLGSKFNTFVKSKSKLNVQVNASGKYGSTIKTYSTTITDSGTYSGGSFTSDVLKSSGTVTIASTVTDTRGRSNTSEITITVADYYNPTISEFTVNRCTVDGTIADDGEYLSAKCTWDVASVGDKNDCVVKLQWLNGTTWADLSTLTGYSGTSTVVPETVFSVDNSYTFRLIATDYFTSSSVQRPLGTSFTLINFHSSGHALSIGKLATLDNTFEVDLASQFNKNVNFGASATVTDGYFYDKFNTKLANGVTTYTTEGIDPNTTLEHLILTNHTNCPASGFWYIKTEFYNSKSVSANRMQIAYPYSGRTGATTVGTSPYYRNYYDEDWSSWVRLVRGNEQPKTLWGGSYFMNAEQSITLSEAITSQMHGITLTFSYYANGSTAYNHLSSFFIPKSVVTSNSGKSHSFTMTTSSGLIANKVLTITNTTITGVASNATPPSGFANANFVLVRVTGV